MNNDRPAIASWLPDETAYSLACRQHVLAGSISCSATCAQVFGHARRGSAHDLPCNLDRFALYGGNRLGSAEDAAIDHTILPYYLVFQDLPVRRAAVHLTHGDDAGALKARLGIPSSRFGAGHPLKACPACMSEDERAHGVAYWHRTHQFPGIWVCPTHQELLRVATTKWNGVDRFAFRLPRRDELSDGPLRTLGDDGRKTLARLANDTLAMLELSRNAPLNLARSGWAYRQALEERGAVRGKKQVCAAALSGLLVSHLDRFAGMEELASLPVDESALATSFLPLIRGRREVRHPLKHLLLIGALFPGWEAFEERYCSAAATESERQPATATGRRQPQHEPAGDPRKVIFLGMLQSGSASLSGAARIVGVTPTTAQAWAAAAGHICHRRPKSVKDDIRNRLISDLTAGGEKAKVALDCGVSLQTVTRMLRTEVGLREAWACARHELARQRARQQWLDAASQTGQATGVKALRQVQPATYTWLYRNDREWLQDWARRHGASTQRAGRRVDWAAQDKALAQEVVETVRSWEVEVPARQRLTLAMLSANLRGLKKRLSKLHKLPLTREAIQKALSRGGLSPDGFLPAHMAPAHSGRSPLRQAPAHRSPRHPQHRRNESL
jgi:hypothetical protein